MSKIPKVLKYVALDTSSLMLLLERTFIALGLDTAVSGNGEHKTLQTHPKVKSNRIFTFLCFTHFVVLAFR